MGIYDRDYERSYDTGSGWRDGGSYGGGGGGFRFWSANGKLLATLLAVFVVQNIAGPAFTDLVALPSNWLTQPWRFYGLLTYSLLHADFQHIVWNSLALYFFGAGLNRQLGGREYLAFFFAAAIFGGIAWTLAELAFPSKPATLLLGASGGIAGVVLLFCLTNPNAMVHVLFGTLPIPASMLAVIFVGGDIYGAYHTVGNVAYTAHLGGALFAFLCYRFRWRVSDWLPDWLGRPGGAAAFKKQAKSLLKRKPKLRVHRNDEDDDSSDPVEDRVDEILRKIQSQGQSSLTREEQRILEQASRRYKQRRS